MKGTVTTYYKDSATADPTDTGDKKSYGEMGVTVTHPIKYVDLKVTHYILPPNQPDVGARYDAYFSHPLQTEANEQRLSGQATSTPTGSPTVTPTPTRTSTPTVTRTPNETPWGSTRRIYLPIILLRR